MEKIFHGLKLLTHCGGGAYGDVYYCENIAGKKLAVKIISKSKLGESWERELKGVINYRKITENTPGLLQIFHVEEDEETFFYTMECADNAGDGNNYKPDTLAMRLKKGPIPAESLHNILSAVLDDIQLIHDAGFAHRDIKPDNILFVNKVPKLADIGLLSSLANSMTMPAGTLDFIPPEARYGVSPLSTDKISRQRNDLYAFGKVIYCAVTGAGPHEYPAIPREMPLNLSGKYFLNLSFRLCCKEPAGRLDSIEEAVEELAVIRKKLLRGETPVEHFTDILKNISCKSKVFSASLWRWFKHGWPVLLFFILLTTAAVHYWEIAIISKYAEAVEHFRSYATEGHAGEQYALGNYYYHGWGFEQNYDEAVKWYRKSAEQGNGAAQNMLGICYAAGRGVKQDPIESLKWIRKAAEQGNAWGQRNLGFRYFNGIVVEKDMNKAFQWFNKSAEQGNADALRWLGICYHNGAGTEKNYSEAFKCFEKAAKRENPAAQYWLGVCYWAGHGTAVDRKQAKYWFEKAAKNGNENARKARKAL